MLLLKRGFIGVQKKAWLKVDPSYMVLKYSDQDSFSNYSAKYIIHLLSRQHTLITEVAMVTTIYIHFQFKFQNSNYLQISILR